ncbi:hypothetical protein BH11MYX3_BH11MYX3_14360 [soil metagenome]
MVLFLIMVAHALLETARDALFLTKLGPDRLAWAYVAIAVTALAAFVAVRRWNTAHDARWMLLAFLIFALIGTSVLAVALRQSQWAAFVLYVWTGLVASLVVPTFWLLLDAEVKIGEAKRVVARVAAGGSLGALVGSALASVLAQLLPARHLVTAGAIGFGIAAVSVGPLLAGRHARRASAPKPKTAKAQAEAARADRSMAERLAETPPTEKMRRYGILLVVFAVVSTVTLTVGDLMFKRVLSERIDPDQIATVFGAIYTGLNVLALLIQIVVTPRLIERLGVGSALAVLPMMVLATSLGFVLTGAAVAVLALKLADGGLRNSIHRVTVELLYLPMGTTERERVKPIVEVVGQRGGQAVAAVLVLTLATGATATWTLAIMTVVMTSMWLVTVFFTRRGYLRRFRDTLDAVGIQREVQIPDLDEAAISMLTATLASPDERQSIAALGLLAERGRKIPALVLYHPSTAVVRHALSLLEGDVREDVQQVRLQLTQHADPDVRVAALAASSRTGLHPGRLIACLDDPEPAIRAAAAVGLMAMKNAPEVDIRVRIDTLRDGTTAERVALAHAIVRMPSPVFKPLLLQLLSRKETAVTRLVLRAWEIAPDLADVDRLLLLLENPRIRGEARAACVAGGERYLTRLVQALDDPRTSLGVRRHLPRTISRFGTAEVAAALIDRLPREPDGTTAFKILRALGRMTMNDPTLAIDGAPIRAYAERCTQDALRYARLTEALELHRSQRPLPGFRLLHELLHEKRTHAVERVFRAHGILHPRDDFRSIHDALLGADEEHIGAAREILEHLMALDERTPLFELIERGDKPSRDEAEIRDRFPSYTDVLSMLLADPSDSLRCVAAHHVAERKITELRDELMRLKPLAASKIVTQAFEQAIARLDVAN